jgi:nitrate/nitrite transporter NarK
MTVVIMIVAVSVSTLLLARVGPKILVTLGMLLSAVGMVFFTQLSLTTNYLWPILPGLLVMGAGLGFIFATAMNSSTIGVAPTDAGVASALVNACQQVGGALGTALLSTIAASAATSFGSPRRGRDDDDGPCRTDGPLGRPRLHDRLLGLGRDLPRRRGHQRGALRARRQGDRGAHGRRAGPRHLTGPRSQSQRPMGYSMLAWAAAMRAIGTR